MIVSILPSSTSFHAVEYNENKVNKGSAFLLEMKNFGYIENIGYDKPEELVEFLQDYSSENNRIKKPQFHVAFSCKGKEMSFRELLDFAHEYLKEMGYGEEGQPLLVYAHTDTENNHIHVITSRVNPYGEKIKDSKEQIKSQKVIDKLLNLKTGEKAKQHLEEAKLFNFRSVTQYRSILESMGYETYEKNNRVHIKKGGMVQASIDIQELEPIIENNEQVFEEPDYKKLFGIFCKYRDLNTDINGLKKDLRKKFGLDLVFFGRKDSPYGFVIIDYNNKCVLEGSKVMGVKRLFLFQNEQERFNKIDNYIYKCLEDNPDITTKELNQKLKRMNAYIRKNTIYFNKQRKDLDSMIAGTLRINNKMEWINSFNPKSEIEYRLLAKLSGIELNKINIPHTFSQQPFNLNQIQRIKDIIGKSENLVSLNSHLKDEGLRLIHFEGSYFIYNSREKLLIDVNKAGLSLPTTTGLKQSSNQNNSVTKNKSIGGMSETGHGVNREWEVGTKKKWDEVDDGSTMKY